MLTANFAFGTAYDSNSAQRGTNFSVPIQPEFGRGVGSRSVTHCYDVTLREATVTQQAIASVRSAPLLVFAGFAALCVVMVFHSLTQYLNQDEEVFVAAAYLAQHLRVYADFLYLQSPIYPLVLSKPLMLFSGVSPFLIARLFSAVLAIGSIAAFFKLAARLSRSIYLALTLASVFASAPLMLLAYGSARNDIMPIFFGLWGVWFAIYGLDAKRERSGNFVALFIAGICMALAVGAKVTAAFVPLSALLYIYLRAKPKLLPLILGGAVGSLPIVYCAVTDFDKFLFCNVTLHFTMYRDFYSDVGLAETLTRSYQARTILRFWVGEPALLLSTLFMTFATFIAWRRGALLPKNKLHLTADRTFIFLLAVTSIPFVFLPLPTDRQYLQPAVPYVLLSCAALFPIAQRVMEYRQIFVFAATAFALLALQAGRFVVEAAHSHSNRSRWIVVQFQDLSAFLARHVKDGAVATLYPALILDAGRSIYPQFATGVFFFRSGDHLAPERVLELNGISPKTLALVLGEKPPFAVFTANTDVDRPLLNWAQRNCYKEVDVSLWNGFYGDGWKPRLFVRPQEPGGCQ